MRKLGWFAVTAVVVVAIAASVLLLAANLYVQSQGAQQRIRQTLADALHSPVTLKKTTVTPWAGLRFDGITLQAPSDPNAPSMPSPADHFLTADSFRVQVAWLPLLARHEMVVQEIVLDHPHLSWKQDTTGRWLWPGQNPTPLKQTGLPGPSLPGTSPAEMATAPTETPAPPALAATTADKTTPRRERGGPGSKIRVRHGSLDFLNEAGKPLAHFEEVNVEGQLASTGRALGKFHFQHAAFARAGLQLTNFHSAFTYDDASGLTVDGGKGEVAGGELLTDYKLRTGEAGTPFSAECRIANVDLSRLIREAGSPLRLMEGRLQGEVRVQGATDEPDQRKATGQLRLLGAQLQGFFPLEILGEALRIPDLTRLRFKKAELDCQLDGNNLQIDPINLVSNDLQVSARGRYSADEDQLVLHGRMVIDQAVSHQLPQFIEMNFTPCGDDAPGSRYIEFDVTGPLDKPSTNLFDRMLAGPSNGLLQNLLAPKPKRPHHKSLKAEPPTPTPAPAGDGGGF